MDLDNLEERLEKELLALRDQVTPLTLLSRNTYIVYETMRLSPTHMLFYSLTMCTLLAHQDASQDDLDREEMYARAEELDQHLSGMEGTLKKIVHDYNQARQPAGSSSSSYTGTGCRSCIN